MKSVKSTLCLFFLFLLFLNLSGCSKAGSNLGDTYVFGQDDQYYFIKPNATLCAMAESEDGYYFFSGPEQEYLYYIDKKTMKPIILCNKPDCLHTEETDGTKLTYCNAYFGSSNCNIMYYGSSLYVFSPVKNKLYQVSLDGTKRKEVTSFPQGVQRLTIHRGNIYYATSDHGTISGQESSTKTKCVVYRADINNPNAKPEVIFEFSGVYADINKILGYGNGLYISVEKYEGPAQTQMLGQLLRYDILSRGVAEISGDIRSFQIQNEKLLFNDSNNSCYIANLDGTGRKKLDILNAAPLGANDKYIYFYQYDENDRYFTVLDWDGKRVASIEFPCKVMYLFGGSGDYYFVGDVFSALNEYGYTEILWMIDKNKLSEGSAVFEKVFEFIPKVHSPGEITEN